MKSLFASVFCLFLFGSVTFAQNKIDSTVKPFETTYFDGPVNTIYKAGFILKTRSKNFYQITGKTVLQNKVANPIVTVYKQKRKYQLAIQGIAAPLPATKIQDVIESNIDGTFRGWDGSTSFKLLNGDTWVQDEIKTLNASAIFRPEVYIYMGSDGTYKMKVAGVDEVLQVKKK